MQEQFPWSINAWDKSAADLRVVALDSDYAVSKAFRRDDESRRTMD